MGTLAVRHLGGDRFGIGIRDHEVVVDQPAALGGEDTAPTPTELFVASLTACVAFYARRYLTRHDLPVEGLEVTADFRTETKPSRVSDVDIAIRLPDGVPGERRAALLAVASHCTVHNSLTTPPTVGIAFREG